MPLVQCTHSNDCDFKNSIPGEAGICIHGQLHQAMTLPAMANGSEYEVKCDSTLIWCDYASFDGKECICKEPEL